MSKPSPKTRQPTNQRIADEIGISERHLTRIKRHGTASCDLAEKVGRAIGVDPRKLLRPARPVGRPREESPFTFRDFILDDGNPRLADEREEIVRAKNLIMRIYEVDLDARWRWDMPHDFRTLEHLLGWAHRSDNLTPSIRDRLPRIWTLFRIWKIEQAAAEAIFAIEVGDDVG